MLTSNVRAHFVASHYSLKIRRLKVIMAIAAIIAAASLIIGIKLQPAWLIVWGPVGALALLVLATCLKTYLNYAFGQRGERSVLKALAALPDEYHAIANWKQGSSKEGDADVIVVGPTGILLLEVKTWTVPVVCEGDKWFLLHGNGFQKPIKSPTKQAKRNAKLIESHIGGRGTKCTVIPVVVFNNSAELKMTDPTIPIIRVNELVQYIQGLPIEGSVEAEAIVPMLLGCSTN